MLKNKYTLRGGGLNSLYKCLKLQKKSERGSSCISMLYRRVAFVSEFNFYIQHVCVLAHRVQHYKNYNDEESEL